MTFSHRTHCGNTNLGTVCTMRLLGRNSSIAEGRQTMPDRCYTSIHVKCCAGTQKPAGTETTALNGLTSVSCATSCCRSSNCPRGSSPHTPLCFFAPGKGNTSSVMILEPEKSRAVRPFSCPTTWILSTVRVLFSRLRAHSGGT